MFLVPMVIEESSVVAAASNSAKYWAPKGGFRAEVISTTKVGQVHFIWKGEIEKLQALFPQLKDELISLRRDFHTWRIAVAEYLILSWWI